MSKQASRATSKQLTIAANNLPAASATQSDMKKTRGRAHAGDKQPSGSLHSLHRRRPTTASSSRKTKVKPFQFRLCDKTFSTARSLQRHSLSHSSPALHYQTCPVCDKTFSTVQSLQRHSLSHSHSSPALRHTCPVCDKHFTRAHRLKKHELIHTGEKPFECLWCGKRFNTDSNMAKHLRTHTGEKPYQCTLCDRWFSDWSTVRMHRLTHTGEKPFQCFLCHSTFSTPGSLNNHLRNHPPVKYYYKCVSCGRKISHSSNLKWRRSTISGEEPDQCGSCGKKFGASFRLPCNTRRLRRAPHS